MDARQALDEVMTRYNIKASALAQKAGIGANELSRYRRGHNDILSTRAFSIVRSLPLHGQMYFWSLICTNQINEDC